LYGACRAPEKDEPKRLGVAGMAAMTLRSCNMLRGCVVGLICNSRKAGVFVLSSRVVKSEVDLASGGLLGLRAFCRFVVVFTLIFMSTQLLSLSTTTNTHHNTANLAPLRVDWEDS
jgi:hypothetical protein